MKLSFDLNLISSHFKFLLSIITSLAIFFKIHSPFVSVFVLVTYLSHCVFFILYIFFVNGKNKGLSINLLGFSFNDDYLIILLFVFLCCFFLFQTPNG